MPKELWAVKTEIEGGRLTLHSILHVLSKQVPHHLCADLPYVQFLREPEEVVGQIMSSVHMLLEQGGLSCAQTGSILLTG